MSAELRRAAVEAATNSRFEFDGERFAMSELAPVGEGGRFSIVKHPRTIGDIGALLAGFSRPNIVELGIAYGGSSAFLALAGTPRRFLALDYRAEPVEILEDFIERRALSDVIRTAYGVDQGDVPRLRELIADTSARSDSTW